MATQRGRIRGDRRRSRSGFKGLSFTTVMQVLIAFLLVAVVSYVIATIRNQAHVNDRLRAEVDTRLSSRNMAEDLETQFLLAHVTMLDFLTSGRSEELRKCRMSLSAADRDIDQLQREPMGPNLENGLKNLRTEVAHYSAVSKNLQLYALPSPGLDQSEVADISDSLRGRMRRVELLSDMVRRGFQARFEGSRTKYRAILDKQPRKMVAAGAVVSLMLIILLARQVSVHRSLRTLSYAIRLFERGNFAVRLPIVNGDELGQVNKSFNHMARTVTARREQLLRENMTDALTGLYNQRQFRVLLHDEFERAMRDDQPFSLLMIDVDHFKNVNDAHGHEAGNAVLRAVAMALSENIRDVDILIRYGGDEFVAILPGAGVNEGWELAARLVLLAGKVEHPGGAITNVTLSIGGATFPLHAQTEDDLILKADNALYLAKDGGRARANWTESTPPAIKN